MDSHRTTQVYTCPDHVRWVKDNAGILVVDEQNQRAYQLTGSETAVWDWLMLDYTYRKVVRLTAVLLDISLSQAQQHLHCQLQTWQQRGLLTLQGGEDG